MGVKQNQHIVPQMHLRQWAGKDNRVWAYDIKINKVFNPVIKVICAINDYYEIKSENNLPYSIEEALAEEIEGPATIPLEKLLNEENLSAIDIDNLCFHIGYQVVRTPFIHKQMSKLAIKLMNERALKILNDDSKFNEFLNQWLAKNPGKQIDCQKMKDILKSDKTTWKITSNEHNLAMMMILGGVMKESYKSQRWTLLKAVKNRAFICNDNPVITITGKIKYISRNTAESQISPISITETIIPISPNYCLLLDKGKQFDGINIRNISEKTVREINTRIVVHTDRTFIARDERLLKRMIEIYRAKHALSSEIYSGLMGDIIKNAKFKSISRSIYKEI